MIYLPYNCFLFVLSVLFVLFLYVNYAQSIHLNCCYKNRCAYSISFFFKKCERKYNSQTTNEKTSSWNLNNDGICHGRELSKVAKVANVSKGSDVSKGSKCHRKGREENKNVARNGLDEKHDQRFCFMKNIYKSFYKSFGVYDKSTNRGNCCSSKSVKQFYASRYPKRKQERKKQYFNLNSLKDEDTIQDEDNIQDEGENDKGENSYELINEYILLKKNGKSIKELMDEGKWMCPKENIRMIRERTKQKINWNYILKKNNELLKDNVNKIYKEISNKNTVNDIFFIFETYPYNYLSIPMSIYSLYKITSCYMAEVKKKEPLFHDKKIHFFNFDRMKNIKDDNFFAPSYAEEDVDMDLLKIKEERKRLNEILKNKNFRRIVGSLNKHLKIIYKIFSTNHKLTAYEKNKKIYEYIPYINIQDIIIILKCFCILKFEHVNIFKYIYFFIVFFIEKFDIYFLTEAVYLCILKNIYVKPLFQNYTKYLVNNLDKWDITLNTGNGKVKEGWKEEKESGNVFERGTEEGKGKKGKGKEGKGNVFDEETKVCDEDAKAFDEETKEKKESIEEKREQTKSNGTESITIDPEQSLISLYESIKVNEYFTNIERMLEVQNETKYTTTTPLHMTEFEYTAYESGNYSDLNYSQDELKMRENDLKQTMKKFTTQNYLKEKKNFLEKTSDQTTASKDITKNKRKTNFYVNILYTLSKFPYTNSLILNKLCSKILTQINTITFEEMVLTFYSLAVLEYNSLKLQHCLYISILKNIQFLNFSNKHILLKLIKALYLTNNLISVEEPNIPYNQKENVAYETNDKTGNKKTHLETEITDKEKYKSDEQNQTDEINKTKYVNSEKQIQNVKQLMLYIISRIVFKKKMDYTPIELVDIIRYMSSMNFVNKKLFHFVFSLPFFKNINEEILNDYKNNVYLNNSYYAYTKNNMINTPIEIMLCKFYQAYLGYQSYTNGTVQRDNISSSVSSSSSSVSSSSVSSSNVSSSNVSSSNVSSSNVSSNSSDAEGADVFDMEQLIAKQNREVSSFILPKKTEELLKQTYLKNMEISTYSTSSLHYEIADILIKDFKIPCHVEYKTEKGILIDIAILYNDLQKIKKNLSFVKNIAIEINGPFHYKTKNLISNLPQLNTKTIFKKRLLENDNWEVISFPFWEIKPWFSKTRKEKYIFKMLPENIKNAFSY